MADEQSGRPADSEPPPETERPEEAIRTQVRELTSQLFRGGPMDPQQVEEVVRTMTKPGSEDATVSPQAARESLAEALGEHNEQLVRAGERTQRVLSGMAAKGADLTENDLKEALSTLSELQGAYTQTAARLAEASAGSIRDEFLALAGHAGRVGADAGARAASAMADMANRFGSVSRDGAVHGMEAARDYSARMSLLASGVLAGIADALREPGEADKDK